MKNLLLIFIMVLLIPLQLSAAEVQKIGKDELKNLLDSENLIVLDVRTGSDWSASKFKIKGAVRVEPGDVASWSDNYDKAKTYVLYCA